ncbi:hypothetical protein [Microbacterium elymi]|uniref:hypothetical protein n=1 Tax=Microbacterium elymi TaxID=2909587 RepID=UPI00338F6B65
MLIATWSTSATPYSTWMNTCQKAAYTISSRLDSIRTPNSSTASGMSATDGIGRRNSTVEWVARRRNGESPMTTPSTQASTTAMRRPSAQASMVSPTATQKSARAAICTSWGMTSVGGGRYLPLTSPLRAAISQIARKARMPARPSSVCFGRIRRRRDRAWATATVRVMVSSGAAAVMGSSLRTRRAGWGTPGAGRPCGSCRWRCGQLVDEYDGPGDLVLGKSPCRCPRTSSAVRCAASSRVATAIGTSPHFSSGTPISATPVISGICMITPSTSAE